MSTKSKDFCVFFCDDVIFTFGNKNKLGQRPEPLFQGIQARNHNEIILYMMLDYCHALLFITFDLELL